MAAVAFPWSNVSHQSPRKRPLEADVMPLSKICSTCLTQGHRISQELTYTQLKFQRHDYASALLQRSVAWMSIQATSRNEMDGQMLDVGVQKRKLDIDDTMAIRDDIYKKVCTKGQATVEDLRGGEQKTAEHSDIRPDCPMEEDECDADECDEVWRFGGSPS